MNRQLLTSIAFLLIAALPVAAAEMTQSSAACLLINEGYLKGEPQVIKSSIEALYLNTAKKTKIYSSRELSLRLSSASTISPALSPPWVEAFTITVVQMDGQKIAVRSSSRKSTEEQSQLRFSLSKGDDILTIKCSTR